MIPANANDYTEYVLGPIIGFPFDTTLAVARLCYDGVFTELPHIRWILGHLGGAVPYLFERMDNGWRDFAECRTKIDERCRRSTCAGSITTPSHSARRHSSSRSRRSGRIIR